ncbi:MAG TPA: hypothetical protein VH641_21935 [Streptosporangiaceae bacterium]|jgi:hypothetical protein
MLKVISIGDGAVTMSGDVIIGVAARTGWAVAIALGGTGGVPRFAARREIELATAELPGQPYHVAAGMALGAAEELIGQVERFAEQAAADALRALAGELAAGPAGGSTVGGVAVVVKPVALPESVAAALRSHAWMHAAEGVLYREALLAGARSNGWRAHAVEESGLPAAEQALAELGGAAGRPWRRYEKDAARAALTLLASQ